MTAQNRNQEIIPKRNSPYSRFGLGDLQDQYLASAAAMGGLSATFQDPFFLNPRNPASLAFLQATAFEVGINAKYALIDDQDENTQAWSGNLDYLALGFPLKNPINEALEGKRSKVGLGMAFALQPYSVVGYDVLAELPGNGAGRTVNSFKGTGGTYRLSWGNGLRWNNLGLGLNVGYLFGKLTNSRRVEFPDLTGAYASEFLDETSFNGLLLEFGAQYTHDFKERDAKGERKASGKRLILGAFGSAANSFGTNSSRFILRDNIDYRSGDTILLVSDVRESGTLPAQFTVGLAYENVNRLRAGIEYSIGKWSSYQNVALPDNLADTWGLTAGLEYTPDYASYNNYFERLRYRLGGFYRSDPRVFNAGQLQQYALTIGVGMPIVRPREQLSFINLALELGQFGHPDLIRETYFKLALGFTLNDNTWFFKRKFN